MLQQTQVETMLPYYGRFLKRFPTLESLANGTLEEVLTLWSGLGYYSRARNLHRCAQKIIFDPGGAFPETKEALLALPGIGEYTASAIASIAFGERVGLVDGNVIRVLTRFFALKGDPKSKPLKEKLWKLANRLVPKVGAGDFNQALMELGALVCLPQSPRCTVCPLKRGCKAREAGKAEAYPSPKKKPAVEKIFFKTALIERDGFYLLAKRNGKRHLQSMWEFPRLDSKMGLQVSKEKIFPKVRHSIMNRQIHATPVLCRYRKGRPKPNQAYVDYKWIRPEDLKHFPTSSLNHKVFRGIWREETPPPAGE